MDFPEQRRLRGSPFFMLMRVETNIMEKKRAFLINIGYYGFFVILLLLAARYLLPVLMPFLVAFVLAFLIQRPAAWIARRLRAPKGRLSVLLLVLVYVAVFGVAFSGGGRVFAVIREFVIDVPDIYRRDILPLLNYVLEGVAELSNWLETAPERRDIPLTMVSQTTSTRFIWDSCVEKAKKECTNLKIFDTICNATCKRQSEAQALAARSDAMVVIGGRESSNTKRLAELCGALCPMVVWIERAAELEPSNLCRKASIGITAGASTPEWIIKEVYDKMSDENIEIEESFAEMLEKSIKTLNTGEKVTGVVTGITPTEIYVDLGTKHAGYIPVSELTDDPTAKVEDLVKIGDEIETYVMRVNDQEGVVTLSKKRLDTVKSWDDIEQAREEHTTVEGVVTEENKGGVVVSIKGVRVFVPASQTGLPRETPMSQLLKQHVRLRITEVNRARRRVVGSIRAVEAEERAAKAAEVWANIEENKRYTGTVKSLTSYGAFVDIGGVDGMVHISELSWSRIKHPSEVVSVGDTVEVYVISFDKEKKKISLGMKDRSQNPWEVFTGKYQPGDVANVRVVKLMTFGAFAEVVPGVDGLIHISQIADHRIDKPGDVLSEGQMVDVKIIDIDYDNKKVSLSIRALLEGGDEPAESEDVNEE